MCISYVYSSHYLICYYVHIICIFFLTYYAHLSSYKGTNIDSYWRTARAFSTMAIIIGGVVTFWALLAPCLSPSKRSFKTFGMAYMICCLFIGLSLLLLNSTACHDNNLIGKLSEQAANSALNVELSFPESCSMGPGANCTIAAVVLWFVAGVASLRANPPAPEPITTQTHDVTYTKTTGEDGAAVVSETGKSAFVLFCRMNSCVQYEVSIIWMLI